MRHAGRDESTATATVPILSGFPDSSHRSGVHIEQGYDFIVLDLMILGLEGFAFLSTIRREGYVMPALILTARGIAKNNMTELGRAAVGVDRVAHVACDMFTRGVCASSTG